MAKGVMVYLQGKGSFFHHLLKGDQEYKNWNVRLYFDDISLGKFRYLQEPKEDGRLGILNEVKENDAGESFHHFKRPFVKDFGKGDEQLTPPQVTDREGKYWNPDIPIGDGSDITVGISVYPYQFRGKKGTAIRLESVRVDNLVPYTPFESEDKNIQRQVKGLNDVPLPK